MTVDDPQMIAREYATLDRLRKRRFDVIGWLRFGCGEGWTRHKCVLVADKA